MKVLVPRPRSLRDHNWFAYSLPLLGAVACLGCGSRQEAPQLPTSAGPEVRLSTAEEEADSSWSSTYGNPRPKLSHVLSLGTVDLPAGAAPAPLPSPEAPQVATTANTPQTARTIFVGGPGYARSKERQRRSLQAARLRAAQATKQASTGAPPKTPRAIAPTDDKDPPTKRTSIVAPTMPRTVIN